MTLACLKTSVGLITSCAETFAGMFKGLSYRAWAIIFSIVAFGFANFGLSNIISYSLPVLMFLYPLAIVLIVLSLCGKFFGHDRRVYRLNGVLDFVRANLPLAHLGLGWVCPAALGLVIGLAVHFISKKKAKAA